LWIHGKRTLPLPFTTHQLLIISCSYSWVREKRPLVRPSDSFYPLKLTVLFQFLNYTRYPSLARCWEGLDGLFLF